MKKVEYEKKDGTKGVKYVLEPGDKVTAKFSTVKESKLGQYMNYSLGIEEPEQYIQLTAGQAKGLAKFGDLTGKTIIAYEYENDFGKQVGCKAE